MLEIKCLGPLFIVLVLAVGFMPEAQAGEIQELQISDPQPDHGAGEAPWGPEGAAERERRRSAKLDYTQAMDQFNAQNYEAAVRLLQNYLAVFPGDDQARAFLAKARSLARSQKHGRLKVTCRPQAEVFIDGQPRGRTPAELELPVGAHEVEVRALGRSQTGHVFVKPRTAHAIQFDLQGRWLEEEVAK